MKIDAVIPIRFSDAVGSNNKPRFILKGKSLWEITIEQALSSKAFRRVIVACDDEKFVSHLKSFKNKVQFYLRPTKLSKKGITTIDVLANVAKSASHPKGLPDYFMLLEITHPLRPKGLIAQVVKAAKGNSVDSLVTAAPVHYNFWRRRTNGAVERFRGAEEAKGVGMYQELVGIASLFNPKCLGTEDPFGKKVDIVSITQNWALIDVRDSKSFELAKSFLASSGINAA